MKKITGTFLDEISHDIPHQNWSREEWDRDFYFMRKIGIDTVILIRCGYKKWLTYPSKILLKSQNCYEPPVDLVRMFLELSEKHDMAFYFGLYDSGSYWHDGQQKKEVEINLAVIDEVWRFYGQSPAFCGWYLSQEVSRRFAGIVDIYSKMGYHCKAVSNHLPVLISPYIDGIKNVSSLSSQLIKEDTVSLEQHEKEWNDIMSAIHGAVDIVAFQDGHVEYEKLADYLSVNSDLAAKHGLRCWTNCESFDRDMPIKFLPIKWEKMRLKLLAAEKAGVEKAITFEFSHFMSPQSCYPQAHNLYQRYLEETRHV
ncbi:DUF4434 domain-containing protein [candidate division KSB1 bacterium]|nr:DUF4434 domain-containing protein [candidate division KSB1 bacterium]